MLNKEPAVIINGLAELVRQLLPLMSVVGVITLPQEKLNGWNLIISLVLAFVSTVLIRQNVVSPSTANKQIQKAIDSPSDTTVKEVIKAVEKQEALQEKKDAEVL